MEETGVICSMEAEYRKSRKFARTKPSRIVTSEEAEAKGFKRKLSRFLAVWLVREQTLEDFDWLVGWAVRGESGENKGGEGKLHSHGW
jgi:hypothetical protein